jgi:uncharacterized oxidoreductase
MQRHSADFLTDLTRDIFVALDSHGIVRIPQYVGWTRQGPLKPGGRISIVKEQGAMAILDCGSNFGQVGGLRAMEVAITKAKEYKVACVVAIHCCHVGRLGYFTHMAAEAGMFALAFVNSPTGPKAHGVVPYGGLEGRITPNPLSYAAPGPERPIVADMALTTTSGGKVVVYRNRGRQLPEGWIIDAAGNPSTDPNDLFRKPQGWILPLGGNVGYKGFAFLLLSEMLAGTLAGNVITDDLPIGFNGVCFMVLDISAFLPVERFREAIGVMTAYMKSAPPAPGFEEVLMPGEIDFRIMAERQANGIPIDPVTWQSILDVAEELQVPVAG